MGRWIIVVFAILGTMSLSHGRGDDLSASYVGCRLLASGHGDRLFSHDPVDFSIVEDPVWRETAQAAGVRGILHPYVQTPLWVFALRPVCTTIAFKPFCSLFVFLSLLALGGMVLLAVRHWATSLRGAGWIVFVLAMLWCTQPFRYGVFLAQNHALFLFLAVLALVWAERGRSDAAGVVLALATIVKITPGFLVIYWLIVGRYRAAVAFGVSMIVLEVLTVSAVGTGLTIDYVHELSRISNVLLVAYNNQSLAAWWGGRHSTLPELLAWRIGVLPPALKLVSLSTAILATIIGGALDCRRGATRPAEPPVGAVLSMLAITMFTPIAWSHYYIVLVLPVVLFLDAGVKRRAAWPFLLSAAIFALSVWPLAGGQYPGLMLRGPFRSGLLALAGLVVLALWSPREAGSSRMFGWRFGRTASMPRVPHRVVRD